MANTTKRIQNQKGLSLIESIAALAVTGIILAGGVRLANDRLEDIKAQTAAKYQQQVDDAATRYIHDNFSAITAVATASAPAKITVPMLQSTGYLPASFNSMNGYGQTACVLALQPVSNKLQTLVVTEGGQPIPTKRTPLVAASIGASGGYIPNPATGNAQGSFGAWTLPLSGYTSTSCSGTPAGPNHLATALFFDNGNLISDYLYRNAVPGHPEANQMATALDMTNNNINNGGTIGANTVNATNGTVTTLNNTTLNGGTIGATTVNSTNASVSTLNNTTLNGNTINGSKVNLPAGNSLQIGSSYYYGDGTNSAIRQNGYLYVQNPSGGNNDVYANDYYVAAAGKWASQLGGGGLNTGQPGTFCDPGSYCGRSSGAVMCFSSIYNGAAGQAAAATYVSSVSWGDWTYSSTSGHPWNMWTYGTGSYGTLCNMGVLWAN